MSASCSIELCTAMPFGDEVVRAEHGRVEDLLARRPARSRRPRPRSTSLAASISRSAVSSTLGDPAEPLAAGRVLPQRRCRRTAMPIAAANCRCDHPAARPAPRGPGPRPRVGTVSTLGFAAVRTHDRQEPRRVDAPRAPCTPISLEEPPLVVAARRCRACSRRDTPALCDAPDPRGDAEAQQQPRDVSTSRRLVDGVVDPAAAAGLVRPSPSRRSPTGGAGTARSAAWAA